MTALDKGAAVGDRSLWQASAWTLSSRSGAYTVVIWACRAPEKTGSAAAWT